MNHENNSPNGAPLQRAAKTTNVTAPTASSKSKELEKTEMDNKSSPTVPKKRPPQNPKCQPEKQKVTWLSIDQIEKENPTEFQFRQKCDVATVDRYVHALQFDTKGNEIKDGRAWPFPPIVVYLISGIYIVLSGMHRLHAAIKAGRKEVLASVFDGNKEAAIWYGVGANRKNGLPLKGGDLKHCIQKALEMGGKSNRAIAIHLGCHPSYVDKIAKQLPTSRQPEEKRTGKDGKQYSAKKSAQKKKAPVAQDQEESEIQANETEQRKKAEQASPETTEQSLKDRFREFLTYVKNAEKLSPKTGVDVLQQIYNALEPELRKAFVESAMRFIKATSEFQEMTGKQNQHESYNHEYK